MRRVLALSALAAALAAPASAHAAPVCEPLAAGAGVCASVADCTGGCHVVFYVDPYCVHNDPRILACDVVDRLYVTLPSS